MRILAVSDVTLDMSCLVVAIEPVRVVETGVVLMPYAGEVAAYSVYN